MNPEKEIINWWLNKNGYFTINSIKVARNKEIDILALKSDSGLVNSILHIETASSISSVDNIRPSDYAKKFEDKLVVAKVKKLIKKHIGKEMPYEKTLVLGATSRIDSFQKLAGIKIMKFERILFDVFNNLDKQNYRNDIIRTMQLLKYLLLTNPKLLAKLLEKQDINKILKQNTREVFLKNLVVQPETKRILEKESNERLIIDILKNSSLNKPEKFAKILEEEVLGKRSRKKFLNAMLKSEELKQDIKKELIKKEKPLHTFFGS